MRFPEFLKDGGTIAFAAPSFGCAQEPYRTAFDHAQENFRSMGYACRLGPNCYEESGTGISSTPEACAEEIMELYEDPESSLLLSCGGGELMCEILPYIDFGRLQEAAPKWFMGYSDNTNLGFLLPTICDTASIYGPNAPAFGMEPWHPALEDAWKLLTGRKKKFHSYDKYEAESLKDEDHPLEPYNAVVPAVHRGWPEEDAEMHGRLLGGCLDCLTVLCGTRYDRVKDFKKRYRGDRILWFLEACDLNVFAMRRALWQLREAGWFDGAGGFLIGRPRNGAEMSGLDHIRAVTDILGGYGVPILLDLDIGHLPPQMPLVNGALADVVKHGGDVELSMRIGRSAERTLLVHRRHTGEKSGR